MSDNILLIKNIFIILKILMFLNVLDLKKKINFEIGINSVLINIIFGMVLVLLNIFVNIYNVRKVIFKVKNICENI